MDFHKFKGEFFMTKTRRIAKIGMLAAAAFILQVIGTYLGIKVGGFLDVEISDLPALIGALALGPGAGVTIELVKNILHCFMTSTGFVGEAANFIVNGVFVFTAGMVYKSNKTKKTALIGLVLGTLAMSIAGIFANMFLLLPLYVPDWPAAQRFKTVFTLITPFNICKGAVLAVITTVIYKKISPILKGRK